MFPYRRLSTQQLVQTEILYTHTATCTNRKFLNTEISPIDVSTRRHFAQRHFCTQQLLHPDILLHRCFCPLQDFTCKKNVFTDKCVHSQKLLTQKWKQRAAEKVAMVQVVYISLGYACVFFQRSCAKIAQTLLHTDTFTHRSVYAQKLLHTEGFTHRH